MIGRRDPLLSIGESPHLISRSLVGLFFFVREINGVVVLWF
jgi:hypothetical protein